MNNSSDSSNSSFSFQNKSHNQSKFPVPPHKKPRRNTISKAVLHIKTLGLPLISRSTGHFCDSICLEPYRLYTIGRKPKLCNFIFIDRSVSKRHCQLFFDSFSNKIYLSDGFLLNFNEFHDSFASLRTRGSLNGVFVDGARISRFFELQVGNVVSLACGHEEACASRGSVVFLVEKIVFTEEVDYSNLIQFDSCSVQPFKHCKVVVNTNVLLSWCRDILCNNDPLSFIRNRVVLDENKKIKDASIFDWKLGFPCNGFKLFLNGGLHTECHNRKRVYSREVEAVENDDDISLREFVEVSEEKIDLTFCNVATAATATHNTDPEKLFGCGGADIEQSNIDSGIFAGLPLKKGDYDQCEDVLEDKNFGGCAPSSGKKFYLNRLRFNVQDIEETGDVVSLPELFHPIETLKRVFVATFTSDISWFLSYCKIPPHLPVTIACHSAERCWSSDPDKRTSVPFSDFPNLTVVYPPFPETIAFNKDKRNSGIGCHHPKLIVLQREDNLRVVVTSANLVAKQWHHVSNTVWWQDFPRLSIPNCFSIFTQLTVGEINIDSRSDFAAQLAGFMATLVADVPCQAHWILELVKYNFDEAVGYLVASVPGIHSHRIPCVSGSKYLLVGNMHRLESSGAKSLASIEASVVGLSHIYRTSADSNGAQLKKLALFLRKCRENVNGMSEVVLRRDKNIPADMNAVSVLIPNPEDFLVGDFVQLGFLPRHLAKWVAPLLDIGIFAFSAYIYPKEVLATALEGSSQKVKLILNVYAGPSFSHISEVTQSEYVSAVCSLVALSQRSVGLWRLKEVLGQYKWPEHLESEFFFGSSSVGAITAQFLAAFSAAAGKRSVPFNDSEESDPEWGCWSASQELKNPSLGIIFPSIERVKNSRSGIMASRRMLCFSEKTWQRLKNVGIVHDAIPHRIDRAGFPMHVKVGRRRFQSKKDGSSFGWVYCGSHNFSAAAWGRPMSDKESDWNMRNDPVLGSRLHISNYELGIIFIVPPPVLAINSVEKDIGNLDNIVLPFVVPPPKYKPRDRPATAQAIREALNEMREQEMEIDDAVLATVSELAEEEIPEEEEEEVVQTAQFVPQEKEDEMAYADKLWSQVDSSESH